MTHQRAVALDAFLDYVETFICRLPTRMDSYTIQLQMYE